MRNYWVVGKIIRETEDGAVWQLQGVFSSEELAEEAALAGGYFMGPVVVDEALPDETTEWPGMRWPSVEAA